RSDTVVKSGGDIMRAINIPQEAATIPETIDAIRAALKVRPDRDSAAAATNSHPGPGKRMWKAAFQADCFHLTLKKLILSGGVVRPRSY
ncbi:MAG: hypothetical protein LBO05_06355, partial [Deltaproteobacteria bacterium]|nr:hypothetical protein [Deltaproteobacteria bacterium]